MGAGDYNHEGTMTVSVVDGKLYFENMFQITYYGSPMSGNYYGTLSEDGTTIIQAQDILASDLSSISLARYSSLL